MLDFKNLQVAKIVLNTVIVIPTKTTPKINQTNWLVSCTKASPISLVK